MSTKIITDPRFANIHHQFTTWRSSRQNPREVIPAQLFDLAGTLLDKHPPAQVASALGINSGRLKRHLGLPVQRKKALSSQNKKPHHESLQVIEVQQVRIPENNLQGVLASLECPGGFTLNLYKLEGSAFTELLTTLKGAL